MKVNKKQNPLRVGKASQPVQRVRRTQAGASRNRNPQGSIAAAYSTRNSGRAPQVTASYDSCRVVHREFLSKVTGQTAFTIANTFAINPGLSATFPWLANIAQNWETYRFNKLRFMYYTSTGSTTVGSVILAPDYDASDTSPINEQVICTYEDVQEDAPWKDIVCSLRPAAMHALGPRKFVRVGVLSANQDIKTYDVGNFFTAVVDASGAVTFGKLYVEYDVTFYTPQIPPGGSSFAFQSFMNGGTLQTQTNIFGTAGTQTVVGSLGMTGGANTLTFPSLIIGSEYFVSVDLTGTGMSAIAVGSNPGFTLKSNLFAGFNAGATSAGIQATFTATATSGTIVFTATATTVTVEVTFVSMSPTSTL